MNEPLQDWPRPAYTPGGGEAFLFYVLFGSVAAGRPLSSSEYRCAGVPGALDVMRYGPDCNPEVADFFRSGDLWDSLQQEDAALAERVAQQTECIVIRGTIPDPQDLNYFRDTIGLITYLLDSGGVAVYDPQMLKWWSADEWRKCAFMPASPTPRNHVVILVSEDANETEWLHTRGMRKFGRPDLSVPQVSATHKPGIIDLCQRLIEMQAFGATVREGQNIRMPSLPPGGRCHHAGHLDDPDFNNVHIRITWSEPSATV